MAAVKCSAALMLWGLIFITCTSMVHCIVVPQLTTVGDNRPLNPGRITVGSASNLALQVRCSSNTASSWSHSNGIAINEGLSPFGVSQEDGVLRVYPVTLLNLGPNDFVCSDGNNMLAVQFDRVPHLFFTSPVPRQAPPGSDIISLCPVSDIPTANVTVVNGTGFSYCLVTTERGLFRSRSIVEEEAVPSFAYEPVNLEINSFNETSRAAFSCGVSGIKPVASIEWYFEMMMFGSEIGLGPGLTNGLIVPGMDVSILTDTGNRTSVLVVENAGNGEEGFYHCQVTFTDGQTLSSRNATLMYHSTTQPEETLALSPPTSPLTVYEGGSLLLPCVSTGPSLPVFSRDGVDITTGVVTMFGLELNDVTTADSGVYTCTVGRTNANVMISVTNVFPPNSVTVGPQFATPPEAIISTSITQRILCVSTPTVALSLLMNNVVVTSLPATNILIRIHITEPGLYQCASSQLNMVSDNLYASEEESIYLLRPFLTNPSLPALVSLTKPLTGSANTTLNCTTSGNPLPRLTWTVDNVPSSGGVQAVTGFMETAYSTLTLSTDQLELGTHTVVCTASLDDISIFVESVTSTATVLVLVAPVITTPPVDSTVLAPELAVFTCTVEGFPLPTISWVTIPDNNNMEITLAPSHSIMITESSSDSTLTSTLTLVSTAPSQAGRYVCVASNTLGEDNATVLLTMNAAPAPVITTPPVDSTVLAPEQAVFTCTVEGFPLPTISWVTIPNDSDIEMTVTSGNNIDITGSNSNSYTVTSTLTIVTTDFTLAGVYVCVASNSEGMANESAILTVNVLPRFLVNPVSDVLAVTGDDITLNCTAEGNPLPIVTWAVNTTDKTLSNPDENFDITLSNNTSTLTVTSVLRFTTDVMEPLRGNGTQYFCRASNGLEPEIESNATLLTIAVSSPPTGLMAVSTQATTISLTWGAPSSPNGVITHYDVSFVGTRDYDASFSDHTNTVRLAREDISTDGGFKHSLEDLFPNTQYTVTVIPVNGAGRGMASSVTVNTLHEPVLTQLRLVGVDRCQQWVSEQNLNTLSEALSVNVEERCQCGFSVSNVLNPTFRCFPESENAVTYRAEVSGTVSTSPAQIVDDIENWLSDGALVTFNFITIPIDSSCRVGLSSNTDPECNGPTTEVVTTIVTTIVTPTSPEISPEFPVAAVGGAVGGVIVLIIAIVVLILSVYIWLRIKRSRSFQLAKNMPSGAEMNVVIASSDVNEGEYETIDNFQDTTLKPQEYEDIQFPPTTSPNPPPTLPEYEYVTTGTVVSDTSKKDFDITDCAAYGVTRTH